MTPAAAAVDAPTSQQQYSSTDSQQQEQQEQFNWHQAWYPVAIGSQLDPQRPHGDLLLGIPIVLWKDGQGT